MPPVTVAPGVPLAHHPSANVLTVEPNVTQSAVVIVSLARLPLNPSVKNLSGEGRSGLFTPGLANLGRINAFQAQLYRFTRASTWARALRHEPQGIAVGNAGDSSMKHWCCWGFRETNARHKDPNHERGHESEFHEQQGLQSLSGLTGTNHHLLG